jgi:hypothetical protein
MKNEKTEAQLAQFVSWGRVLFANMPSQKQKRADRLT